MGVKCGEVEMAVQFCEVEIVVIFDWVSGEAKCLWYLSTDLEKLLNVEETLLFQSTVLSLMGHIPVHFLAARQCISIKNF